MSQIVRKNHFNPCFWTAYWNKEYYDKAQNDEEKKLNSREQIVRVLNIKANKILKNKVENLHFDKDLGVAEITKEDALDFCKRNFPNELDNMKAFYAKNPEDVFIDGEDILTGLENSEIYRALIRFIKCGEIISIEEKTFLAGFVIIHELRSHAILNSFIELYAEAGIKKFEYFWMLRNALSDPYFLYLLAIRILSFKWTIYSEKKFKFPLSDSPIIKDERSILATLSPKHLLEIHLSRPASVESMPEITQITPIKFSEFKRRLISNSFKEIIFDDKQTLRGYQRSKQFKKRMALMNDFNSFNKLIAKSEKDEIWQINAFGSL